MNVCLDRFTQNYFYSTTVSAIRALIQSLIPDAALGSNGKLSGQDVTKLTEKLSELVGPSAVQGFQQTHNERGEVCSYSTCLSFDR